MNQAKEIDWAGLELRVWRELVERALSLQQVLVMGAILKRSFGVGQRSVKVPKQGYLAQWTGMAEEHVSTTLKELDVLGLVVIRRERKGEGIELIPQGTVELWLVEGRGSAEAGLEADLARFSRVEQGRLLEREVSLREAAAAVAVDGARRAVSGSAGERVGGISAGVSAVSAVSAVADGIGRPLGNGAGSVGWEPAGVRFSLRQAAGLPVEGLVGGSPSPLPSPPGEGMEPATVEGAGVDWLPSAEELGKAERKTEVTENVTQGPSGVPSCTTNNSIIHRGLNASSKKRVLIDDYSKGSAAPGGLLSGVELKKENWRLVKWLLDGDELSRSGAVWRLRNMHFPEELGGALNRMRVELKEGKNIRNRGAYLTDLFKRFGGRDGG